MHPITHTLPLALLLVPLMAAMPATAQEDCPPPDAADADAVADAFAVRATLDGQPVVPDDAPTAAAQSGPGAQTDEASPQVLEVPGILHATSPESRSSAQVAASPVHSTAIASAQVGALSIMDGLVEADAVRADVRSEAEPQQAWTSSIGSTIENLRIDGQTVQETSPGQRYDLPAEAAGEGSYMVTHVRTERTTLPTDDDPFYRADLQVTMMHVVITDASGLPGEQRLEVEVASAHGVAASPTLQCGELLQSVLGHTNIARVWPQGWDGESVPVGGPQHVGPGGGEAHQEYADLNYQWDTGGFATSSAETFIDAKVEPGLESHAKAVARLEGLCIDVEGVDCFVQATAVRTAANAHADPWAAYHWGNARFVDLQIGDTDVCAELGIEDDCRPAPNTKMTIDGVQITLNEQWDLGPGPGFSGISVKAIRIESDTGGHMIVAPVKAGAQFHQG